MGRTGACGRPVQARIASGRGVADKQTVKSPGLYVMLMLFLLGALALYVVARVTNVMVW